MFHQINTPPSAKPPSGSRRKDARGRALAAEEEKSKGLGRARAKLEQSLDEAEENCEREKRAKNDVDKARRKVGKRLAYKRVGNGTPRENMTKQNVFF